jgi:predicted alpha/beta hydrolase
MTTVPITSADPVESDSILIASAEGVTLPAVLYGDADSAQAAVVVNSALGVPHAFYRTFASFLVRQGYCVLCYDYQHNAVQNVASLRGSRVRVTDWAQRDFAAAVRYLRTEVPGRPLICIGHSIGGQLPGLAGDAVGIDALIGVCSQSGEWRLWSGAARRRAWLQFHLIVPLFTAALGYFPGQRHGLCNMPRGVAWQWAHWCRLRGYATHPRAGHATGFSALRSPALFISTYDDQALAPREAVDALGALYLNAPRERLHIGAADVGGRAVGHFGFFNPATGRRLWPRLVKWLQSQPLKTGATCPMSEPTRA